MIPMTNSTDTSSRLRGSRSAMAPANSARKFSAIRAAAMEPTRNGESVSERTNQPQHRRLHLRADADQRSRTPHESEVAVSKDAQGR